MNIQPKIRLVSFDIWETLVINSPVFKESRIRIFAEAFGMTHDLELMNTIRFAADSDIDKEVEATGKDAGFAERIVLMGERCGKKPEEMTPEFIQILKKKIIIAFMENPPVFLESNIKETLQQLREKGLKIAFLSNTGLIDAENMKKGLEKIGLLSLADYTVFSDEEGIAKPDQRIFQRLSKISQISLEEIVHVGNSFNADYEGAWRADASSILFDITGKYNNSVTSIQKISEILPTIDIKVPLHYSGLVLNSLHIVDGEIKTEANTNFDLVQYSKFKYGDGGAGKIYGHRLAKLFIESSPHLFVGNESESLIITTSPYKAIAKGSSSIVRGFKTYINEYLRSQSKKPLMDITILKDTMFSGDYGTFTDEQRKTAVHKDGLFVLDSFIKNKKLIIIDDVRITGSHEQHLVDFFQDKNIQEIFFLYIAKMDTVYAKTHPEIESIMNNSWVTNFDRLAEIMSRDTFVLNARVCKYILSSDDLQKVIELSAKLSDNRLYDLYGGIIGDGYGDMEPYKKTFSIIQSEVQKRALFKEDNDR